MQRSVNSRRIPEISGIFEEISKWQGHPNSSFFTFSLASVWTHYLQETYGTVPKRARSDGNTKQVGGTSAQREEISRVENPNEPEEEGPERPRKQAPGVQSAIYTSHKISSFDISYTINLILVGMWLGF
jgi:hypothetical protein